MTRKIANMKGSLQTIPEHLIYEMVNEQPIYYRGYRDFLKGEKQLDEIIGSSYLQSLIITEIVFFLKTNLGKQYQILTNEVGLQFKKGWRAADIAIVEKKEIKKLKSKNKYLNIPPKIVIEIDTKADIEKVEDSYGYFHKKTDELIEFGVEKVIWIFTDSEKVMISEKNKDWKIQNWSKDINVIKEISFNLKTILTD